MKNENEPPRRIRLDLMSPAELSIVNAVREVEKIGADVRLTNAVILLGKARDSVADYIDGVDTLTQSGERGEVERLKGLLKVVHGRSWNAGAAQIENPDEWWETFKIENNL